MTTTRLTPARLRKKTIAAAKTAGAPAKVVRSSAKGAHASVKKAAKRTTALKTSPSDSVRSAPGKSIEPLPLRAAETGTPHIIGTDAASENRVAQEHISQPDRIRARHTIRLEEIYRKAILGHAQSCEDERTEKRTAQGEGASGEGMSDTPAKLTKRADAKYKVESTRRARAGDIRYLTEARNALSEIRRIWGIDSASSSKSRPDDPLAGIPLDEASEADLALLDEAYQTLRRLTAGAEEPGSANDECLMTNAESGTQQSPVTAVGLAKLGTTLQP